MNKRASQNKPELWIEEDRRIFYAEAITIKSTGECFKVEDKLAKIHTYMVDQYNSYQADGKSFYEDQRDIATKCKCTPKTLGKWLKVLQALGLLIIDESQKSHSYTVRSVVSQEHNLIFSYPKLLNGKPSYDHEEALKRLYTSQGRRNVKNHQPKTEESGKNEQKRNVEPAAPAAEQTGSVPPVDAHGDVDLSGTDDPSLSDQPEYTDEQLRTKLRKWRNWGLDEDARSFCMSRGVSDDEDSMKLFIQNYQLPVPGPQKQQADGSEDQSPPDFDNSIPF
ncbi:DUF6945 domain-containing protein [Escherichia coli]|uniref:DUF6945 domain-containing protein n=1 Tax=Escherichia coli TaxID=562 RepID=UPI001C402540|nr:hypothetical protein [Escherichia coli]EIL1426367.1 hypothetical protein [Escherichia coli]HAX9849050.1 hypothetical protein [Escherichia coli]